MMIIATPYHQIVIYVTHLSGGYEALGARGVAINILALILNKINLQN